MEYQHQWMLLRRAMLQMDRQKTRKKSIKALKNLLVSSQPSLTPLIWTALSFAYFYDQHFEHAIYYCKKTVKTFPIHPESIFCASMLVHLYRLLDMTKEHFEAEGSRIQLMKNIIMQSKNQDHRKFAMEELKQAFQERDLLPHFYTLLHQVKTSSTQLGSALCLTTAPIDSLN